MAPSRRAVLFCLGVVLTLAAASRFVGITHHLKHGAPDFDERNNFVEPVLRMWRRPTANPSVYAGYPGFFNYITFLPIGLGNGLAGFMGAYTAGRAVVAAFSVANVFLLWRLGSRALGAQYGLFAAALLLVSRVDLRSAQHITPDTLVASAALGALLILGSRPMHNRAWIWLGALAGAAAAVKLTGVLVAASALVGLGFERRVLRSAAVFAIAASVSYAVLAPYAALGIQGTDPAETHAVRAWSGVSGYYGSNLLQNRFFRGEGTSLPAIADLFLLALGPLSLALTVLSIAAPREIRPVVWPALGLVGASVLAILPANMVYPRHVVPGSAVAAFLAATGLKVLIEKVLRPERMRAAGFALVALPAIALPARNAWPVLTRVLTPSAVDQAAVWIESQFASPTRIVTSLERFQLAAGRFEVRHTKSLMDLPPDALAQYDLIVARTPREVRSLSNYQRLCEFPPEEGKADLITVLRPPFVGLDHAPPDAVFPASGPAWQHIQPDGFIELRWSKSVRLTRIHVEVPSAQDWPRSIGVLARRDGGEWERLACEGLRPIRASRQLPPYGQIFVPVERRELVALRLVGEGHVFSISAVRTFVEGAPH